MERCKIVAQCTNAMQCEIEGRCLKVDERASARGLTECAGKSMCARCVVMNTPAPKFRRGDLVRKRSGSQWQGSVVGEYSTTLTPEGYAVESDTHSGSVQIYPAAALELLARSEPPNVANEAGQTARAELTRNA